MPPVLRSRTGDLLTHKELIPEAKLPTTFSIMRLRFDDPSPNAWPMQGLSEVDGRAQGRDRVTKRQAVSESTDSIADDGVPCVLGKHVLLNAQVSDRRQLLVTSELSLRELAGFRWPRHFVGSF